MPTGYSGTRLAKKLSLKPGQRAWWENVPDSVRAEIAPDEIGLELLPSPEPPIDAAHVFVVTRAALEDCVARLRPLLAPAGFLWVSWPKKASKVPTDVTEDVLRDVALPTGLVDVKVCAVDATWSALKLMIRRELR
jgi:hypothetical protein